MEQQKPIVRVSAILSAFWKGMKPYTWGFIGSVICYSTASIVGIFEPLLYKRFFDVLTTSESATSARPELIHIIVVVLILNAVIWFSFRIGTFLSAHFQSRTMAALKQNAYNYLIEHSYTFFANNFSGSLVQRVNRFARSFERLSDRLLFSIIPLTISITGVSIVLWRVSPIITLCIVGCAAAFLVFNYFFSRWKLKYNLLMAAADSKTTGYLADTITNSTSVQLFNGNLHENQGFKAVTEEQSRISIFTWNLSGVVDAVQALFIFITEFLLFYFAIGLWSSGSLTIGTFVLIQVYFTSIGSRLWDFSRIIRDIYEGFADAREMLEILLEPHEIKDLPTAKPLTVTEGQIELKDVCFNFNSTRSVLDTVSLEIKGGEKVALIGPSGAGKSTLVRLLLRLYDIASGSISVDGHNIKYATLESLRRAVSFVPQDPVLFHRTLRENIRYGRQAASDAEVEEAARLSHSDTFIKDLPLGYETYVGERGIKLSGGERQRIAIARAILKNAPILILDEATSSLDSESESLIQDALETLMKGKTVIVIAHRLSTIRKMDRIIVLSDGKILEEGSHDSLLQNNESMYKKLWDLQAGGFIA